MPVKLLLVTWDGSGTVDRTHQLVPLLGRLRAAGDEVHVLQFRWRSPEPTARLRASCEARAVAYDAVQVRRSHPVRVALSVLVGAVRVRRLVRARGIDVVVVRGVLPAAMALVAGRLPGRRRPGRSGGPVLVYDADGLLADQRVEHEGWSPHGLRAGVYRRVDRAASIRAARVLVRTGPGARIQAARSGAPRDRFAVVVNGKDAKEFSPGSAEDRAEMRMYLGIDADEPVVAYAGCLAPPCEVDAMLVTFERILERAGHARLLLLTPPVSHPRLRRRLARLPAGTVTVRSCAPDDVPRHLAIADLGLAYRRPTVSQRAVAPSKVAEYLLCGVPVAYTRGIGDLDQQLAPPIGLGVPADESRHDLVAAWLRGEILPRRAAVREACRAAALLRFSLDAAVRSYRDALAGVRPEPPPVNGSARDHAVGVPSIDAQIWRSSSNGAASTPEERPKIIVERSVGS